jgi:hypothetical protein
MSDLTTLAAVKADLFPLDPSILTADDRLTVLISAISAEFERECGHSIASKAYTAQLFDGNGRDAMVLPDYPVSACTALTVDGVTVPQRATVTGDGWILADADVGLLRLVGYELTEGVRNVAVTYTAGYTTTPKEVEQAVRETIVAAWKKSPNEQLQITSGGGEYTQFRAPFVWPPFAYAVLQSYKRPSVG